MSFLIQKNKKYIKQENQINAPNKKTLQNPNHNRPPLHLQTKNLRLRSRTKLSLPRSRRCRQRCLPYLAGRRRRYSGIRPHLAARNNLQRSIHRQDHSKEKTLRTRNIVKEAIKTAKEEFNAKTIKIEAQVYAKELYEKVGFVQKSEPFLEDGIPHILMEYTE